MGRLAVAVKERRPNYQPMKISSGDLSLQSRLLNRKRDGDRRAKAETRIGRSLYLTMPTYLSLHGRICTASNLEAKKHGVIHSIFKGAPIV
jgi:hypothetical protein